ncbi:MAG: GDP-mannose 4,6-dehydratase [Thermaceae bacterium]
MRVFGTDYPTPDGTAIRDYIHVSDLAQAHVQALEYLVQGGASQAFNLGTGVGHSVHEVIQAVERLGGRRVPFKEASRRPGDPPVLVARVQKAALELGLKARFGFQEIFRTAWRWHNC